MPADDSSLARHPACPPQGKGEAQRDIIPSLRMMDARMRGRIVLGPTEVRCPHLANGLSFQ
eukprot:12779581-Alexandrium_andersonii.AAC.1